MWQEEGGFPELLEAEMLRISGVTFIYSKCYYFSGIMLTIVTEATSEWKNENIMNEDEACALSPFTQS